VYRFTTSFRVSQRQWSELHTIKTLQFNEPCNRADKLLLNMWRKQEVSILTQRLSILTQSQNVNEQQCHPGSRLREERTVVERLQGIQLICAIYHESAISQNH